MLSGSVEVFGAKNAVLKEMPVMLLAAGQHKLSNVPNIIDVDLMTQVLTHIGATCTYVDHTLTVEVPDQLHAEAPLELVRQMRASIIVLGPLLARTGSARVAFPVATRGIAQCDIQGVRHRLSLGVRAGRSVRSPRRPE